MIIIAKDLMLVNIKQNSRFNKFPLGNSVFLTVILQKTVNIIVNIYPDFSVIFIVFVQSLFFGFFCRQIITPKKCERKYVL